MKHDTSKILILGTLNALLIGAKKEKRDYVTTDEIRSVIKMLEMKWK